jgi:hypothetical protein
MTLLDMTERHPESRVTKHFQSASESCSQSPWGTLKFTTCVGWQPTITFVWEILWRLHDMGLPTIKMSAS